MAGRIARESRPEGALSAIPLSVPSIGGNAWKYVKECLDTGWVSSSGGYVTRFEEDFRAYVGARFAVACNSGTSALQLALRVAGVVPEDEVIVPTVTFVATVNAARYLGAHPVFMDCDEFYGIDVSRTLDFLENETVLRDAQTTNRRTGRRISALVPVHVFGNAARLEPLLRVCADRNIRVVEDAAESLGTVYREGLLASRHTGTVGDLGCFSFNGNKIITTGGGGMVVTADESMAARARYLTTQAKDDPVRFIHHEIGYNFRLTNLQAALGVAQLEELPRFLEKKKDVYESYRRALESIPGLAVAPAPDYARNNHWMVALRIDSAAYGRDREQTMARLSERGIETRPLWHLNHLQTPFRSCQAYRIEKACDLLERTLLLPSSVDLTRGELARVVEALAP